MTTTHESQRPPTRNEGTKPPPLWLFRALNPLMRAVLRSPLHGLLSGMLMLLSYTGRKSGKVYTIPIGYFVWDTDELMAFTTARWWTNLRDGTPVTLLLKRRRLEAAPTVIHEREAVRATLEEFIRRLGLATARKLPVGLPPDREPTQAELRAIPPNATFVQFTISERRPGHERMRRHTPGHATCRVMNGIVCGGSTVADVRSGRILHGRSVRTIVPDAVHMSNNDRLYSV